MKRRKKLDLPRAPLMRQTRQVFKDRRTKRAAQKERAQLQAEVQDRE